MKGGEQAKWSDRGLWVIHFLGSGKIRIGGVQNPKSHSILFLCMPAAHVPKNTSPRFEGNQECGLLMTIGSWLGNPENLLKTRASRTVLENTMIVFQSDNGPELNDCYYVMR